ncbi:hypothetical protein QDR37_15865 [Amnibacterium sp. CER49]|uniref:hypothetical protein n=1 Tax=Amnibacterium sp. CER49 TaxID=3039161 RepID=UPI00244B4D51|nr:hypothetical protein [Amnibacterium sp. CER49]MDH2445423.1 hypothetical protein [Amnibacterium sp. CER49]
MAAPIGPAVAPARRALAPGVPLGLAWPAALLAIGALAFVARLALMVRGGGLTGIGGYDDGVYYAAADALVHGRLPYRDFLFLQPPGVVLATAPFAALGVLTSDAFGFAVAHVAFMAVGAGSAVLVASLLRRHGRTAAVLGGLLYAVFSPAVYAERSVLLEPLGTIGVLLALRLLQRTSGDRRWTVLAGVAAGAAVDVKIWYVVAAAVLAASAAGRRVPFVAGFVAAVAAGYLPFVVAAPAASVREIVLDQLGRPRAPQSLLFRAGEVLGARAFGPVSARTVAELLIAVALVVGAVAALERSARVFAVLLAADGLVLVVAPSWFSHYAALTAPPLALCFGVAVSRLLRAVPRPAARIALVAVVVLGIAALNEGQDRRRVGTALPAAIVAAHGSTRGCVLADDPTALATMDVLSRDLAQPRCTVWPDVTGWTYDRDGIRVSGRLLARRSNDVWQDDLVHYLEAGQAVILVRPDTGLGRESLDEVHRGRVIAASGRFVLRAAR